MMMIIKCRMKPSKPRIKCNAACIELACKLALVSAMSEAISYRRKQNAGVAAACYGPVTEQWQNEAAVIGFLMGEVKNRSALKSWGGLRPVMINMSVSVVHFYATGVNCVLQHHEIWRIRHVA